jgi:hypothetical protein
VTHFAGKTISDHLKDARERGALASAEIHGAEMPGHFAAAADAAKETAVALLLLWAVLPTLSMLALFAAGWLAWKTGRSALLGWARLERLHRLIEEERWEIEHHRGQEREELAELYRAKGFTGALLDEVVDVLMADDNRLLQVMLSEELGLTLEAYEHPLKQCLGAFLGVFCSAALFLGTAYLFPRIGPPAAALCILACAAVLAAHLEKNRLAPALVWTAATAALSAGSVYFLIQLLPP